MKKMNRKEFLKTMCKYSVCSCVGLSVPSSVQSSAKSQSDNSNPESAQEDFRIDFMRKRFHTLINALDPTLDQETAKRILEQVGRDCCKDIAKRFKGKPDDFFAFAKEQCVEKIDYDKDKGIVKIYDKKRKACVCPFVKTVEAPGLLCECSIGAQKEIYESLFGKAVRVTVDESVLMGGERCSFTIYLS